MQKCGSSLARQATSPVRSRSPLKAKMKSIASSSSSTRRTRSATDSAGYTDVSRLARSCGIRANVEICSRVLCEYEEYCYGYSMAADECILAVLSYTLQCEPRVNELPVILTRRADNTPVLVTFKIVNGREDKPDHIFLAVADEAQI